MNYNILGITPGHNGSVALVSNGELVFYLEEERLSRIKYDGNPLKSLLNILSKYSIDELVITGVEEGFIPKVPPPPIEQDVYSHLIQKFQQKIIKTIPFWQEHHLAHAANAFYNSGFDDAAVLIVDTAGSTHWYNNTHIEETESIFSFKYPSLVKTHYKSYNNHDGLKYSNDKIYISDNSNLSKTYEGITQLLGFNSQESGKTMGLSAYGKNNKDIPPMYVKGRGNPKYFKSVYGEGALTNFELKIAPQEWHYNSEKITDLEKDLAYHIQIESEKEVLKLVEKTLDLTKLDKIACAGGYFLNCV